MSDQPNPPPKPKPGSLRDRIAAFEKGGASGPAPPPARPKPAGFSTWKPKQPSPPSSPPASDNTSSSTTKPPLATGMSASDAKDSIVKGGSLKDRMAALQGKGAFGAPPPLAPKPATEKPKWKPPPVVAAQVDDDGDHPTGNVVAPRLPPPAAASESSDVQKAEADIDKEAAEKSQATESEDVDEEEGERQRRAAIAARMARLGGARVGMAPIFGKKPPPPPAKRPSLSVKDETPNEPTSPPPQTLSAEPQAETGVASSAGSAIVASQREEVTPNLQTTPPEDKISPVAPSSSVESPESHATRSPPSMPVPAMPRRAAPPRSKKSKPTEQVPETPAEVPAIPTEVPAVSAAEASIPESTSVKVEESSAAASAQTQSVDQAEDPIKPKAHDTKDKSEEPIEVKEEKAEAVSSPTPVQDEVDHAIVEPSSTASDPIVLAKEADKEEESPDEGEVPSSGEALLHSNETSEKEANVEVEVVEDEETRRKKVAERLARMGGVNPFAPPSLPRRQSSTSSDTPASPPHTSLADDQKVEKVASPKPIVETIPEETLSSTTSSPSAGDAKPEATTAPVSSEVETKAVLEPKAAELLGESDDESDYEDSGSEADPPLKYDPRNIQDAEAVDNRLQPDPISFIPIPPPRASRQDSLPARSPTARGVGDANSEEGGSSEEENEGLSRARILEPLGAVQVGAVDEDDGQTPLPIPNRTHQAKTFHPTETTGEVFSSFAPPRRNPPPPPPPVADESNDNTDSGSEYGSDEDDEPLPVRPLSSDQYDESDRALGGGAPLIVPPPTSSPRPAALHQPPPRALPPTPHFPVHDTSGAGPSTSHSSLTVPASAEVLDDEEGDPIDPSFHTPSRRASTLLPSVPSVTLPSETELVSSLAQGLHPNSSPSEQAPIESKAEARDEEAEAEAVRRRTIAERMAKLGGIKFGAAPPVSAGRFKRQSVSEEAKVETVEPQEGGQEDKPDLTEEEEERARKERISAKLAGMGGMRIGMLPTALPPRNPAAAATREPEPAPKSPPPPSRGPPSRPPPPPQAPDSESEQDSIAASDDIVNIEAEESEIEEVGYEEARPEIAPPIPNRGARLVHRTSLDHPNSPPRPVTRPPVPVVRKLSGQTEATQRRTSGDLGLVPSKISVARGQSDYVMVEEPETEEPPPPPPSRPSARGPPSRPPPPPAADTLSSQWELPSIPTSSLDLGGDDLSMSWTDAEADAPVPLGESVTLVPSPNQTPQLASASGIPKPATGSNDVLLSTDDLMAVWGRVGVQVCEVATALFERSKKGLIGDGTYPGFVHAVLNEVPNASQVDWGYLVYKQTGASVQKRASDIMPGDLVEFSDAKFKGHKGLHAYHATFGTDEPLIGVVNEYEPKRSKIKVFQANQSVGQQTVESVSYRLDDLKSGTMKIFRVLEA